MNRAGTIWIIIAVIVVLVLAVFAFTRSADTELNEMATTTAETMDGMSADARQTAARAQAETELAALRVRAEAGETYDELADDFAAVRARVAAGYADAEGAAADEWSELSADFDRFEAAARENSASFLDSLAALIDRFSADVRVETEAEAQ